MQGGAGLKSSQHYPAGFGTALAKLYQKHKDDIIKHTEKQFKHWETKTKAAMCTHFLSVQLQILGMSCMIVYFVELKLTHKHKQKQSGN